MSELRTAGGSRAWGRRRATWARSLELTGQLPCSICGELIYNGDAWDLHHPIPRVHGGRDEDTRPAHSVCNRAKYPRPVTTYIDPEFL